MAKTVHETLDTSLRTIGSEELRKKVNNLLLGVQALACVQTNLMDDIKALLEASSQYKFTLKHNLKEIREKIYHNCQTEAFFGKMSRSTIDEYMKDYERLEKMVYDYLKEE